MSSLLFLLIVCDGFLQHSQSIASPTGLFFSFGLIVVAAWLYRWWSILYLLPGALAHGFFETVTLRSLQASLALTAIPILLMAPFGFSMIRWVGIETEIEKNHRIKIWRLMLLGGFKASLLSLIVSSVLGELESGPPLFDIASQKLNDFPMVFVTEMVGLVTFLFIVMLVLRLTRKE